MKKEKHPVLLHVQNYDHYVKDQLYVLVAFPTFDTNIAEIAALLCRENVQVLQDNSALVQAIINSGKNNLEIFKYIFMANDIQLTYQTLAPLVIKLTSHTTYHVFMTTEDNKNTFMRADKTVDPDKILGVLEKILPTCQTWSLSEYIDTFYPKLQSAPVPPPRIESKKPTEVKPNHTPMFVQNTLLEVKKIIDEFAQHRSSIKHKRLKKSISQLELVIRQNLCSNADLLERCNYALGKIFFILAKQTQDRILIDEYLSNMKTYFLNSNIDTDSDKVEAVILHITGSILFEKDPTDSAAKQHLKDAYDYYHLINDERRMNELIRIFPEVVVYHPFRLQ